MDKVIKLIIPFCCLISFITGCSQSSHKNNDVNGLNSKSDSASYLTSDTIIHIDSIKKISLKLGVNNDEIGYWKDTESISEIGPSSFIIDGNYIVILDTYNCRIKKVNLLTSEIVSMPICIGKEENVWLRDIAKYDSLYVVTSDLDSLYIIDQNLKTKKSLSIQRGEKWFLSNNKISLVNSTSNNIIELKSDLAGLTYKTEKRVPVFHKGYTRGKTYKVITKGDSLYLFLEGKYLKIDNDFTKIFSMYNAINVDWDNNKVVYWSIEDNKMNIQAYYVSVGSISDTK